MEVPSGAGPAAEGGAALTVWAGGIPLVDGEGVPVCSARSPSREPHGGEGDRSANAALDAYAHADPVEDDPPCVYWFDLGETHKLLGTSALNLGNPKRALTHFQDAFAAHTREAYDGAAFPRSHALHLARIAEAHLAMGDVDAAVVTARDAVTRMGGVTSVRGTSALEDLRAKLARRRGVPAVADFLNDAGTE